MSYTDRTKSDIGFVDRVSDLIITRVYKHLYLFIYIKEYPDNLRKFSSVYIS